MKSPVRCLLTLCLTAALVLPVLPGQADAARRMGLNGNMLIRDADDVFAFPQTNAAYQDRIIFDMGDGSTVGNATLIYGVGEFALNISTHRGDLHRPIVPALFSTEDHGLDLEGVATDMMPLQWFDVGLAGGSDDAMWGIRLGLAANNTTVETSKASAEATTKASAYSVTGGYTTGNIEAAATITLASSETPSGENTLEGSNMEFGAGARISMPSDGGQDYGALVGVYFQTGKNDVSTDDDIEHSDLGFMVGYGPTWGGDDWNAAGYATLGFQTAEDKPSATGGTEVKETHMTFPGYQIAAERKIWKSLWVRGGAKSSYIFGKDESTAVSKNAADSTSKGRFYDFDWTAGISVDFGNFVLDGALTDDFVTDGGLFGDQDEDLFTYVSGTYTWN